MKRAIILIGSVVLAIVLVFVLTPEGDDSIALIAIPQGMSVHETRIGRVFIQREGSVHFAVSAKTQQGFPIQWCGFEELFWSPKTLALWDRYGNVVREGNQPRDAIQPRPVSTNANLQLVVKGGRVTDTPPRATVAPKVIRFYERWLNRENLPSQKELVWCPKPLT